MCSSAVLGGCIVDAPPVLGCLEDGEPHLPRRDLDRYDALESDDDGLVYSKLLRDLLEGLALCRAVLAVRVREPDGVVEQHALGLRSLLDRGTEGGDDLLHVRS